MCLGIMASPFDRGACEGKRLCRTWSNPLRSSLRVVGGRPSCVVGRAIGSVGWQQNLRPHPLDEASLGIRVVGGLGSVSAFGQLPGEVPGRGSMLSSSRAVARAADVVSRLSGVMLGFRLGGW